MSSLQGYYGLKASNHTRATEHTELAVFETDRSHNSDDGILLKLSSFSSPPPTPRRHWRSRSLINDFLPENGELVDDVPLEEVRDSKVEKSVYTRQKSDADEFGFQTPEMLMKEKNRGSSVFLAITGKGLALRSKSASRTTLTEGSDSGWSNSTPMGIVNSPMVNAFVEVRKSSSTSNLQDQETSDSSSILTTLKWSLKPDLQALSAAAIARPIFDGLPKPINTRRNKAALD